MTTRTIAHSGAPRAPVETDGLALHSARGRLVLVATVAASGMAMFDATVVGVALPRIGDTFGVGVGALQWVLTGYLLTLASLVLLGGALGDRFGRRRIFLVGTIWFALASGLCAAAPTIQALVAARVLQGVGAALLTPGSLAILQASFRSQDRARVVGTWSGLGGIAGAIGPFVGGWLVAGPGWRWAFIVNLPIAVVVVGASAVAVPEARDPHPGHGIDLAGGALAVLSLGTATWAFIASGQRGWRDVLVETSILVAVVAGVGFVVRVRRAEAPLVPPELFRSRDFTVMNLATLPLYAAVGVTFFLVAYELQVGAGWSALEAGTALLPVTAITFLLSAKSGAIAQRFGPRFQLTVGPLFAAAGLVLFARIGSDVSWAADVLPGALLFGLGLVTFVAPLTATVMGSVSPDHVSVASGVNNAVARTASLAAVSVIPVVSGLTAAQRPAEVTHAFTISMLIAASLVSAAAPVAFFGLRRRTPVRTSVRERYCAIDGPPLQPDPRQCSPASSR
jgi:EmrB/QacA subfamily drug resistance transporter